jgi:uncharacterized protein (UPF0261 family)
MHSVITGGQGMEDTLNGLSTLVNNFDVSLVVWLNSYFGEIAATGKQRFEEFNGRVSLFL